MPAVGRYLSDVEAGGETIFPRAGNLPDLHEKRDCDKMGGIRVPPKQVSQSSGREGEGRCGAGCRMRG